VDARPLPPEALPLTANARLEEVDGRHRVSYDRAVPFFGLLFAPLVRRRAREVEAAADAGGPLPADVPWWSPPAPPTTAESRALASICLIAMMIGYGGGLPAATGGLLTQTLPYAADVYDVGDRALGIGLAIVRAGVLLAIALGPLADRWGRRRLALRFAAAHCFLVAAIGLAPSFEVYIAGHVALRALDAALGVALIVLLSESVAARNRAISLALLSMSAVGGIAVAVILLPVAAAGRGGFAAVYALQLAALPLIAAAARNLRESERFARAAEERHGLGEALARGHRARLVLVGGSYFLSSIFVAPAVEFLNRYLDDVRGFSSREISVFVGVVFTPALPALIAGARLADTRSRKLVGVGGLTLGTISFAGLFLVPPPWTWLLALGGTLLGAPAAAALATFGPELFPTRIRSAVNLIVIAMGVTGSAIGLVVAGALGDEIGIGKAVASLVAFPLLSALLIALFFPETAGRDLDETSGEGAPGARAPAGDAP
jgi:MFS transporter, AAHS family, benzoate transport protein